VNIAISGAAYSLRKWIVAAEPHSAETFVSLSQGIATWFFIQLSVFYLQILALVRGAPSTFDLGK